MMHLLGIFPMSLALQKGMLRIAQIVNRMLGSHWMALRYMFKVYD